MSLRNTENLVRHLLLFPQVLNLLLKEQIDVEIELVYPYEYKDDWQKFYKRSLPQKKDFYSHQNMEGFTGVDYTHPKVFIKSLQ